MSTQKNREIKTACKIFSLRPFITEAATRFTMEMVVPTDRSRPPAISTIVCPIATIPRGAAERAIFRRCVGETLPCVAARNTPTIISKRI